MEQLPRDGIEAQPGSADERTVKTELQLPLGAESGAEGGRRRRREGLDTVQSEHVEQTAVGVNLSISVGIVGIGERGVVVAAGAA